MESVIKKICFLLFCFSTFNNVLYSQTQTDINYGALINSHGLNDTLITHFNMNTAATRARVSAAGQTSNFDVLRDLFPNIIAMNDSSIADTATIIEENRDYIYYYTNALYSRWEAEGDTTLFPMGSPTGIKPAAGTSVYSAGGISGLRSGSITAGSNMFSGPNYSQYIRYVVTNKWNPNPFVYYKVNFRMKASYEAEAIIPIALIKVKLLNTTTNLSYILDYDTLTSAELSSSYGNYQLEYDYGNYAMYVTPPPNDTDIVYWSPRGIETKTPFYDPELKINYEVIPLTNAELYVDYIEVYDEAIWENDFCEYYDETVTQIAQYFTQFSSLIPNLKYFNGIDEPHTLDSYEPIRKVQSILDSLNINTPLHIRFYPEWNNERDGLNAFRTYYMMAQPKRLIFWFAPFWVGDPIRFNMSVLHNILDTANAIDPNYLIEAQAWGYTKDSAWIWHYAPDSIRFSTQTLMCLAHGARGVLFEHFYSYNSWLDSIGSVFYHGLVDNISNTYVPNSRYRAAVAINRRLSGPLGLAMNKLKYNRQSINFLNYNGSLGDSLTTEYLKMFYPGSSYFASILDDATDTNNKHFMVINADSVTLSPTASFKISGLSSQTVNWSVRNVEGGIDSTFNSGAVFTFSDSLSAGQGKLYKVSPVIYYGGSLRYNETISSACSLKEKTLKIKSGTTLTINANYTCSQDIIVEAGGKLVVNPGKTLTFTDGAKLRVYGTFISNGTENNEISINFPTIKINQLKPYITE